MPRSHDKTSSAKYSKREPERQLSSVYYHHGLSCLVALETVAEAENGGFF